MIDAPRRRPRLARAWARGRAAIGQVLTVLVSGVLVTWAVVRQAGLEQGGPWVQLMAFTPYVAAGAVLASLAILALAVRRRWSALPAGGAAVILVAAVLGRAIPALDAPEAGRPEVRVATLNTLVGFADPRGLADLVRRERVDVLAVQELTVPSVRAFDAAGLAELLPYRTLHPATREGSGTGSGLYSRYPLSGTGLRMLPSGLTQAYGVVGVPGASPLHVESVHPAAPTDDARARQWSREMAVLPRTGTGGPVRLLLGDFNSTLDHAALRDLLNAGYRDAADVAGAGLEPTWPFRFHENLPPVTLDHVVVDGRIQILGAGVHGVAGSDHRAVVAVLRLPLSP